MPTAPVDEHGTVLYYEDSSAPPDQADYVTIILIHGALFHSGVWRPMFPYAAKHGLRLVALNQRDYPGSSPLSKEEADALRSPDRAVQERALAAAGSEIAAFTEWLIKEHELPPLGENGKGGVAVLAWSAGNIWPVSFLGNVGNLPLERQEFLVKYLRGVVLYDPVFYTVGAPDPQVIPPATRDQSAALTQEERVEQFRFHVGCWHDPVGELTSRAGAEGAEHSLLPVLRARRNLSEANENGAVLRASSASQMNPDTIAKVTAPEGMVHLLLYFRIDPAIYQEALQRALFPEAWPSVKLHVVWCDMTTSNCMWGAQHVWDRYQEGVEMGRSGRQTRKWKLEGANHFVHWEEPERFAKFLAATV